MTCSRPAYNYSVIELFESQVKKNPNYSALRDDHVEYTYSSLNERANQFARWLQKKSVKEGDFVGILLEPGADFILCILAIVKLGAVYVPRISTTAWIDTCKHMCNKKYSFRIN
ncbi:MAG: AMP-binding protein [Legionellaceae bacterium]|nr:AMP-binding protein [Legionellaceae bacterium]